MIAALANKLKIKENMKLLLLNAPDSYLSTMDSLPEGVEIDTSVQAEKYSFVQVFLKNQAQVKEFAKEAVESVDYDGLLWLCHPKKSSSLYEDLSRDEGWGPIKANGLEAIASIAIDETWSALRFRPSKEIQDSKKKKGKISSQPAEEKCLGSVLLEISDMLEQHQNEKNFFDALAPSYQRSYIEWIASAKREETKKKRLLDMLDKLKAGYKNPYAK